MDMVDTSRQFAAGQAALPPLFIAPLPSRTSNSSSLICRCEQILAFSTSVVAGGATYVQHRLPAGRRARGPATPTHRALLGARGEHDHQVRRMMTPGQADVSRGEKVSRLPVRASVTQQKVSSTPSCVGVPVEWTCWAGAWDCVGDLCSTDTGYPQRGVVPLTSVGQSARRHQDRGSQEERVQR